MDHIENYLLREVNPLNKIQFLKKLVINFGLRRIFYLKKIDPLHIRPY